MPDIVTATNLTKRYGDLSALDAVSFNIPRGAIVGLIGPNGAGKTTALKALLGLTDFDGALSVLGQDPRSGRHKVMQNVCFIADVGVLPGWLKVSDAVDYVQAVHPKFNIGKAEDMLLSTNINPSNRVKQLSKGLVTQLHLALVLAIEVDLLVLDEPTLGLDILHRKTFYDHLLNDYVDKGTSIIISTHQVEEIENLLTHLLFIDRGKILLDASMEDISKQFSEVLVDSDKTAIAEALGPLSCRSVLGRHSMIFENVCKVQLARLGALQVPSVADLFIAKMQHST